MFFCCEAILSGILDFKYYYFAQFPIVYESL